MPAWAGLGRAGLGGVDRAGRGPGRAGLGPEAQKQSEKCQNRRAEIGSFQGGKAGGRAGPGRAGSGRVGPIRFFCTHTEQHGASRPKLNLHKMV